MQVLLVAIGSHGDVLPILALGGEMKRRGHIVKLAAPAPFAGLADRAGIIFHSLGSQADFDRAAGEAELWHPRRGAAVLLRYVLAVTEETHQWVSANWLRDGGLVVAQPVGLGARIAQDRLGLPLVTVHVAPFLIESRHASPALPGLPLPGFLPSRFKHWLGLGADTYVIGPAVLPELNAFRARLDLPPVRRLRYWWNSPARMLLAFPAWFAPPQPDWPRQAVQVGFPLADELGDAEVLDPALAAFLDAGDPPLAFTYGSAMRQGQAFFRTALAVCRRMNRRGVLVAPPSGQVPGPLPPDVVHVSYAPFSALLPRCAALIHHGGIGTVAGALAAGIPQLVVPVAFDHFDEAERVVRLNLGATLSRRGFTPGRAARRLARLLNAPDVLEACAAAKARMAGQDGIPAACDELERFAAG